MASLRKTSCVSLKGNVVPMNDDVRIEQALD